MSGPLNNSDNTTLLELSVRHGGIVKEINDEIAEMHDELIQLVDDFTTLLSEKTQRDINHSSSRIGDLELQIQCLNDTKAMISAFAGIFQRFNSATSKILAVDETGMRNVSSDNVESNLDLRRVDARKSTVTPTHMKEYNQETSVQPQLTSDEDNSQLPNEIEIGSGGRSDLSAVFAADKTRLISGSSKKRTHS